MGEMAIPATIERPILVVEDDEDTVAVLRLLLADEGYASITAPNVRNAIDSLERHHPCLVLLDWSLDGGSGAEVLSAARQRTDVHTPVVLMTGHRNITCGDSIADAVLQKPFDVGELLRVVAHYCRR